MRKPCEHGISLPRGLVCNHGYLFVRVFPKEKAGRPLLKGCGFHNRENQKLATLRLAEFRKLIFMGKLDLQAELPSIEMEEAFDLYVEHAKPSRNIVGVINGKLRNSFGQFKFDHLPPSEILKWRESREQACVNRHKTHNCFVDSTSCIMIKPSAVNRDQAVLQSVFSSLITWSKLGKQGLPKFKLPEFNPCSLIKKASEKSFARDRVPSKEEKLQAQQWCAVNDPELWEAIVQATVTILRKKDFAYFVETGQQAGTQAKTGRMWKVRTSFPAPANLVNHRKRWERLQAAMGWQERLADGSVNPKGTVWHDLRHWAGTILADSGFSGKQIQKAFNHASESMSDRYTHLSPEKLDAACQAVESFMRAEV